MCQAREYLPMIVFSFSRKSCEKNAVSIFQSKMSLTSADLLTRI